MRFKNFMFTDKNNGFFMALGESKKRQYILTATKEGKITGFQKFIKEKDEGYFLIYGDKF